MRAAALISKIEPADARLVVHSVATDGSQFTSRRLVRRRPSCALGEIEPELEDMTDDGDEEVKHPPQWAFSETEAREVLTDGIRTGDGSRN